MRKSRNIALLFVLALFVGSGAYALAQEVGKGTAEPAGVRAGTKVAAQLESVVDTRTAKPGDKVVARVTKDVKQDGQVVIHKGDHLIGHLTAVEAGATADSGSRLGVTFDQLLRGQTTSQLSAVVSAVLAAPEEPRAMPGSAMEPDPFSQPPVVTRGSSRTSAGSSSGGGGLLGGATSTVNSTVGATTGAAASTVGGVGSTIGATTTPARAIRVDSQAKVDQQSSFGSMLSTRQRNLRLESGTGLELRVAGQAHAAPKKSQ